VITLSLACLWNKQTSLAPGPSYVSSELGIAVEILMGRERTITKTLQRETESLYFTAVVPDTEGGQENIPSLQNC